MPAQSRRPASRSSRAQRRSGAPVARTYTVPERSSATPSSSTYVPRRSFVSGPPPVDHAAEYKFIRKDLIRILVWAGLITALIIALAFVL
jgi:hypothetical protein